MATAVSFRKGTTSEHQRFIGTVGEITVDTEASTLWVHTTGDTPGIPLARADLENVNIDSITSMGIAKNDLTNVSIPASQISVVKNNLSSLNYAQLDMSNVNTASLAENGEHKGKNLAYADGSNINTNELASSTHSVGSPLAKADLTNVDTSIISSKLTDLYANKDLDNVNTASLASGRTTDKNLAYADLTNVESLASTTLNSLHTKGIQLTSNLTPTLAYDNTNQYPTTKAVSDALNTIERIPELPTFGEDSHLTLGGYFQYEYTFTNSNQGRGYQSDSVIEIRNASNQTSFEILIQEVDAEGRIIDFEVLKPYGVRNLSGLYVATTGTTPAEFNITSTSIHPTKLQWNDPVPLLKDIVLDEQDGVITIIISCVPRAATIKALIGGAPIAGTWSALSTRMTFTPDEIEDTLSNSWVISLD